VTDVVYSTESGLLVTDRRHHRAREVPQIDPHDHDSNGGTPTSVGPESRPGTHVMYPTGGWHSEAWDGWPVDWGTPWFGDDWSGTGYGRQNTSGAGRVSTAMTCVDLNSRQLASFPIYGINDVGATFSLPGWALNPEPELYASWSDFMHQFVNSLLVRGEAFVYATAHYADGWPQRFMVLNPDAVGVEWIDGHREYLIDAHPVDRSDICHVRYQSWPGRLRGISPLEWAARSLDTAAALERYASLLSTRGGIPWAVLKSPKNLDGTQAVDAQDAWVAAAARRDGAPAVIGNAFELQPLSFSPEQMALLGLREFDERRICAAFGVPGYLVNVAQADGLTYANAADVRMAHWQATLRPLAQLIGEAWSAWLLPRGSHVEFNPDRYVQPPIDQRATTYSTLFNLVDPATGERAMTIAEIRAAERLTAHGDDQPVLRLTGFAG
jgi:HK97 family phage portal protein